MVTTGCTKYWWLLGQSSHWRDALCVESKTQAPDPPSKEMEDHIVVCSIQFVL
jgi:hypothetical protein